jgi:hypothetical protein
MIGKLTARTIKPDLDGSLGTSQDFANLSTAKFFMMKQNKAGSIILPQSFQCQLQFFGQVVLRCVGLGGKLRNELGRRWTPCPLAKQSAATIHSDRQQPGSERATRIPAVQTAKCSEKRFLCDIFRILAMPQHTVTDSEYHSLVACGQLAQTTLLAVEATAYKFRITFRHEDL